MAGVDGARQRHNNQTKRQENGDGWRRDEEDREGKGKRGATTEIIFFFSKITVLWRSNCSCPR